MLLGYCGAVAGAFGAEYQVGDRATANVVTPVQLVVIDQERTEALRREEAQRVPAIFRFNTNAAAEAELKMLTAYTAAKEGFLKAVERTYKKRVLDEAIIAQDQFGRVVSNYQKQNRSFPLSTNLAITWALGESDQTLLEDFVLALIGATGGYLRPDNLSANAKLGPQHARVVRVGSTNALSDLDAALAQSVAVHKSNFVAVGQMRKELQGKFGPAEQWVGKFLAGFVRENCVCEENLTWQSRNRRTDPILTADTYEAGTIIVKAGALIDLKTKAALDELARRTEADEVKAQAAEQGRKAEAMAAELKRSAAEERRKADAAAAELAHLTAEQGRQAEALVSDLTRAFAQQQKKTEAEAAELKKAAMAAQLQRLKAEERYRIRMISVLVGAAAAMFALWLILRRRQGTTNLLPMVSGEASAVKQLSDTVVACPACQEPISMPAPVMRERLLHELARWVKQEFLRRLVGSNKALRETQRLAALQVAELERRLGEIKGPIHERLKVYEERILELERELAAKGAENRELLKATIRIARERLEARRIQDGVAWN
jgi:hypothetical protein